MFISQQLFVCSLPSSVLQKLCLLVFISDFPSLYYEISRLYNDSEVLFCCSFCSPPVIQIAKAVNQGKLVPEDIIFGLLSKRLEEGYYRGETGFILDGIPRTRNQAVRPKAFS